MRHEFLAGDAMAMAGGTVDHARVVRNLGRVLDRLVAARGYEFLGSDAKLMIEATGLVTYPDAAVYCEPRRAEGLDALTNPVVVAEALSPSTRNYDRGDKFDHYRSVSSLRFVLFVEVERHRVTLARRTGEAWELVDQVDGMVSLGELGRFDLAELYLGVGADSEGEGAYSPADE